MQTWCLITSELLADCLKTCYVEQIIEDLSEYEDSLKTAYFVEKLEMEIAGMLELFEDTLLRRILCTEITVISGLLEEIFCAKQLLMKLM